MCDMFISHLMIPESLSDRDSSLLMATSPDASDLGTEAARLTVPQGWTNEPEHMGLDYYWQGSDSLKGELDADYGLLDATPLITRRPESGDVIFLFQSRRARDPGTKYYVWNGLSQEVHQIVEPTTLKEIYLNMDERNGALGSLEMVEADTRAEGGDEGGEN